MLSDGELPIPSGGINSSFYQSFRRAVRSLHARVVREHARPKSMGDLIRRYPFRTQNLAVRELRSRLLPLMNPYLFKFPRPKYSGAENEVFLRDQMSRENLMAVGARWHPIEDNLCKLLAITDLEDRALVLDILGRGRSLFVKMQRAAEGESLRKLAQRSHQLLPRGINAIRACEQLKALLRSFFSDLDYVRVKTELYEAVYFPRHGQPLLTDRFKHFLLTEDQDFIESLPGHSGNAPERKWQIPHSVRFSPFLDKLVHNDILKPFEFLSFSPT